LMFMNPPFKSEGVSITGGRGGDQMGVNTD
jgi:hypothetical protein